LSLIPTTAIVFAVCSISSIKLLRSTISSIPT
jgi:hypothetical protein